MIAIQNNNSHIMGLAGIARARHRRLGVISPYVRAAMVEAAKPGSGPAHDPPAAKPHQGEGATEPW